MTFKEAWNLYSVKLAAFVGAASAALTAHPDILVGLLAIIPVDPFPRLLMAATVGALVFGAPTIARLWPQEDDNESES